VIASLAASGCVDRKPPGVAIRSLKSDIVFGINAPPAVPPGILPPIAVGVGLPDIALPPLTPRLPSRPACPAATRTDSVEVPATLGVTVRPKPGLYRWKAAGKIVISGVEIPLLNQFVEREITDVSEVTESVLPVGSDPATAPLVTRTFSYSMKAPLGPDASRGTQVVRIQVKDNPVTVEAGTTAVNIGRDIVVGDPERGVTLKRITNYAPDGSVISDFVPTPGILLLPLAVNGGEQYQSVSVDAGNGAVVIHDATVGRRKEVDACGTLVDGWAVSSREYFIGGNGSVSVSQYDYVIATQLGGILVYEKVGPPDLNNIPLPTPPVIPGNPLPNLPPLPTTIPPLPVPLPTTKDQLEFTIAQVEPTPPKP
jgi:hypothetical protein